MEFCLQIIPISLNTLQQHNSSNSQNWTQTWFSEKQSLREKFERVTYHIYDMKWTIVAIVAVIGMIHVQESCGMPLEKPFSKFPTIPESNSLLDVFQKQNMIKTINFTKTLAQNSAYNKNLEMRNSDGSTVKASASGSSSFASAAAGSQTQSQSWSSTKDIPSSVYYVDNIKANDHILYTLYSTHTHTI